MRSVNILGRGVMVYFSTCSIVFLVDPRLQLWLVSLLPKIWRAAGKKTDHADGQTTGVDNILSRLRDLAELNNHPPCVQSTVDKKMAAYGW